MISDENSDSSSNFSDCSFTNAQRDAILVTMATTSSISLFMCLVTVCLVFCLRLHKHFTYRLALYQVASSMLFSVSLILQLYLKFWGVGAICEVFGFLTEYFMWVKLLFTIVLTFHFFMLAVYLKNLYKFEPVYVLVSVCLPLFYVWIPFVKRVYGNAGAWCWIRDWIHDCASSTYVVGVVEQFLLWYAPLFISLTISIVVAAYVLAVLTRRAYSRSAAFSQLDDTGPLLYTTIQAETQHNQAALKQLFPLLVYPIIFYLLAVVPLVNRIYDAIQHKPNYSLSMAHAVSIASWGFFSSWALLLHIAIRRRTKRSSLDRTIYYSNPSTIQTGGYEASGQYGHLESSVKSD